MTKILMCLLLNVVETELMCTFGNICLKNDET